MIKAFAFRGSMHYLSPEEGGIYLALRSAGRQWELPSWVEYYRLAPSDWPDFRAAVREALSDGPLTVAELGEALARHREYQHLKPIFDEGAGTLIKPLTWQGDMSFGPPRDGQHTFQRLDGNPRWQGIPDLDDAGPRAITAYLRTYGPATLDHVQYWLGNGLSAGRKRLTTWFSELGDRLAAVDVDGTVAYVVREDVDSLAGAPPVGSGAVPARARPMGDRSRHQGRARHPVVSTGPDDPQGQPGDRRRGRVRDVGTQGRRDSRSPGSTSDGDPRRRSSGRPGRMAAASSAPAYWRRSPIIPRLWLAWGGPLDRGKARTEEHRCPASHLAE